MHSKIRTLTAKMSRNFKTSHLVQKSYLKNQMNKLQNRRKTTLKRSWSRSFTESSGLERKSTSSLSRAATAWGSRMDWGRRALLSFAMFGSTVSSRFASSLTRAFWHQKNTTTITMLTTSRSGTSFWTQWTWCSQWSSRLNASLKSSRWASSGTRKPI